MLYKPSVYLLLFTYKFVIMRKALLFFILLICFISCASYSPHPKIKSGSAPSDMSEPVRAASNIPLPKPVVLPIRTMDITDN